MLKLAVFLRPFIRYIALAVVVMVGQAAAELMLPTVMAEIVDGGMMTGDASKVLEVGSFMLLIALMSSACAILGSYFSSRLALGVAKNLRSAVFAKVESLGAHEFDSFGASSLITRSVNDVSQIQSVLLLFFRSVIYSPIICVGGIVMALSRDLPLSAVFAISTPLMAIGIFIQAKLVIPMFKTVQGKVDRVNLVLRENLSGVRVVRAFNRQKYETETFRKASGDLTDISIRVNRISACMMPSLMLVMNMTTVAIVWFGGDRVSNGEMSLGNMMAFVQYASQILFSVIMVSIIFVMMPRASASAARINEVMDKDQSVVDSQHPLSLASEPMEIEMRGVGFNYAGASVPALSNISFTAKPGETTAIIGGTGSGKSTLVSLIPRLYDATDGAVLVNGTDVRDHSAAELRSALGFVPQENVLFAGTIAENIAAGNPEASREEIERAAFVAQADEFIRELEKGYDSELVRGGRNLSGGQRQRLCIARALVRRPKVYIFDDSFSALDFKTDAALRSELGKWTGDATVIIVAQRVSTVMDADRIIVLDGGRIAAAGRHDQLLQTCDIYKEIVRSQLPEKSGPDGLQNRPDTVN